MQHAQKLTNLIATGVFEETLTPETSDNQHQITMRAAVGTLMGCWDEKRGEITGDRSGKKRINTFKHNTKGTFANSLANAIVTTYDAI
jgi:hypothetical protein